METPAKRTGGGGVRCEQAAATLLMSPIPEDKQKVSQQHQHQQGSQGGTAAPSGGSATTTAQGTSAAGGSATVVVVPGVTNTTTIISSSPASSNFAGPYRLMDTLGKGGLATVKVGVDFSTGHKVAVKIVDKSKLSNPREQVSMAREITIMKLLKHPNVLRLYDVYENQEKIFLILDVYQGGDLYSHLTRYGAMRPSEAVILFRQIMKGVGFCHKNLVIHRDLKPENLLLSSDKKSLVLSDFGLSTGVAGSRNLLKTRCGTIHYISPEVARGDLYVGTASDVWSCGIILFAMVTATLPFDGESSIIVLKKIVRGDFTIPSYLPPDLKDLIGLMLELDPAIRITIPEIKKHSWYKLGASKEDLAEEPPAAVEPPFILTSEDLSKYKPILENLKLLGWEEGSLTEDLLSPDMNQAKMFYKLLIDHKQASSQRVQIHLKHHPSPKLTTRGGRTTATPMSTPEPNSHRPRASSTETRPTTRTPSFRRVPPSSTSKTHQHHLSEDKENRIATSVPYTDKTTVAHPPEKHTSEKKLQKKNRTPRLMRRPATVDSSHQRETSSSIGSSHGDMAVHKEVSSSGGGTSGTLTTADNTPRTRPRQRAATVGDGQRPDVNAVYTKHREWEVSPSLDPNAKIFTVESKKSINQILEHLKICFGALELELSQEKKQKKDSVKLKGRLSAGKKKTQLIVEVKLSENGSNTLNFKRGGKTTKKEEFYEVVKRIEETLIV